MRAPLLVLPLAALAACSDVPADVSDDPWAHVAVHGTASDAMDADAEAADFYSSGAQFGVVSDPESGDSLVFERHDRQVTSSSFRLFSADCLNCGTGCGGGFQKELGFTLEPLASTSGLDIDIIDSANFTLLATTCQVDIQIGTCPLATPIQVGDVVQVFPMGNLATCTPFSVYFDTTDGLP